MFRIVRSHRIETLADALCDSLAPQRPVLDLAPDVIVVPSTGIARWVQQRIAARFGVAANLECPYPAQFLWQTIGRVLPGVPVQSPFDPDALAWRLYRLLGPVAHGAEPELAPLRAYLAGADALARMQLALRIATVFDRYLAWRGDAWLAPWAQGELLALDPPATEAWQAWLWRALLDDLGMRHDEHPFTRFLAVLDRGADAGSAERAGLPERIRLFAVPALAPAYLRAFEALARYVPVECYALAPSREFFGDIVPEKHRALLALTDPEHAGRYEIGNALLAANGRQAIGQHLQFIQLEEAGAEIDDRFDEPFDAPIDEPASTLLHAIQHSILALDERPALPPADGTLQIHACHTLIRQLEALHDELLRQFGARPDLRPADILVCVPDLEAAAPAIDAVFGAVPRARSIPYRITGRAQADAAPLVAAFLGLLDYAHSRASADAALALLRVEACARRFGFEEAALALAFDWLAEAGARWGWDAAHRARLGLPAEPRHTWADALERIVLGYALPDDLHEDLPDGTHADVAFGAVAAVGGVEGTRAQIASDLLAFVAALHALADRHAASRPAAAWADAFALAFARFFDPAPDEIDQAGRIRAACNALAELALRADCDEPIEFALARERLESLLAARAPGGVPTGALTFSGLGPLRGIPARVIAWLGLDDGVFPRPGANLEFDLIALNPRPGDRHRRDEDRALFLDALIAARDLFFIGYRGHDAREGAPSPPSNLVGELIEFVARARGEELAATRAALVREHPLQAFSPRAFAAEPRSHAQELLAAAEAVRRPVGARNAGRLLCTRPLPVPEDAEARTVRIEELVAFLAHPARHFLRARLRLRLELAGALIEEDEPFALTGPADWALRDRLVAAMRGGVRAEAALRARAEADPALPQGVPGERAFARVLGDARAVVDAIEGIERLLGERRLVPVDLVRGPFRIEGTLRGVHAGGLFGWRNSKVSMHARAEAWVCALVHAAQGGVAQPAYWQCSDGGVLVVPTDAEAALAGLLDAWWAAQQSPLLCPPRTAWAMLANLAKGAGEESARLDAERRHWRAPDNTNGSGESEDLWWRALIGDGPDRVPELADFPGATSVFGDAGFVALAQRVYMPVQRDLREDVKSLRDYLAALGAPS